MNTLEIEIEEIMNAYNNGNLSLDEKTYLLQEIMEVRAAQECSNDEILFRRIVDVCKIAMITV